MSYVDNILQQPAKGEWIDHKNKVGHLIAIFGHHEIVDMPDTFNPGKTKQVATVDMADLDDGENGRIIWGALTDKPGIVNKLKNQRGTILGRLGFGPAKAGQSAPYVLDDHTPEDAARFTNSWLPANRAALAGQETQKPASRTTPPAPFSGSVPQVQQAPQQQYVSAPAGQAQFPGQVIPAPIAQVPTMPTPTPQPVAAQATLADGQSAPYTPEAIAAVQRMIADGTLPQMPIPGV